MTESIGTLLLAGWLGLGAATGAPAQADRGGNQALTLSTVDGQVRRMFTAADRNRDDRLDVSELRIATDAFRRRQEPGLDLLDWGRWVRTGSSGGVDYIDIFQAYFARLEDLDRNGDGTLTSAERQASEFEKMMYACPARGNSGCADAERRNASVRRARVASGRLFDRLDWSARRHYRFDSGIVRPFYGAVRDYRTWHALWGQIVAGRGPRAVNPSVDFSRDMLLVAATGSKPSGGYGIQIISVRDLGRELLATAARTSPGKRCGAIAAVTSPADIVRFPASAKPVRWQFRDLVRDCP